MIHYITPVLLDEICSQEGAGVNFGSQLVEVLSVVLDNEVRCFEWTCFLSTPNVRYALWHNKSVVS